MKPVVTALRLVLFSGAACLLAEAPAIDFQRYYELVSGGRRADALQALHTIADQVAKADLSEALYSSYVNQLTQQYEGMGLSEKSLQVLNTAIARATALGEGNGLLTELLLNRARLYKDRSREVRAIAEYESLMKRPNAPLRSVLSELGQLYERAGRVPEAEALLLSLRTLPKDPPNHRAARFQMFSTGSGRGLSYGDPDPILDFLVRQGRGTEAEALMLKRIEESTVAPDAPLPEQLQPRQALADFLHRQQRWDEALALNRDIVDRYSQSANANDRQMGRARLQSMAWMLTQAGKTDEAEKIFGQLLAAMPGQSGAPRVQVLSDYSRLLMAQKRYEAAGKLLDQADAAAASESKQPWLTQQTGWMRADLLAAKGDAEGAKALREQVQKLQVQNQPQATAPKVNIHELLNRANAVREKNPDEALALAKEALASIDRSPDGPMAIGSNFSSLAAQFAQAGKLDIADYLQTQAYQELTRRSDHEVNALQYYLHNYAQYLTHWKQFSLAKQVIAERRELILHVKGPDAMELENSWMEESDLGHRQGDLQASVQAWKGLLAHQERVHGEISETILSTLANLSGVYQSLSDMASALPLYERSLTLAQRLGHKDHRLSAAFANLANAELQTGQKEKAIEHMKQAVELASKQNSGMGEHFRRQLSEMEKPQGASRWFETPNFKAFPKP